LRSGRVKADTCSNKQKRVAAPEQKTFHMTLIATNDALVSFCAALKKAPFITVDTEFMREKTYWSKLCLVQVAGPEQAAAIDPLAEGIDLAPLFDLMNDPNVLKVFHAARQDIEIFVNLTGQVPSPLFDTQVAGMVCGYGEAASYETLATKLAGAKIDKSSRFTDWSRRPLTDKQVTYALGDVTHLRLVYQKLRAQLEKSGRGSWVDEEMAILLSPATYQTDPREMWRRLKLRSDKPRFLALVRELAAWREAEAQRLNIPRSRVMKDDALIELAHQAPTDGEEMGHMRGVAHGFADSRQGHEVMEAIRRAQEIPLSACPKAEARRSIPNGCGAVLDLLRVLLKQVCDEHGVAAKLIASGDDLELLATEDAPAIKPLTGWRRTLFGDQALALKQGKLALAVKGRKTVLIAVE
jgi:ribonuclease D